MARTLCRNGRHPIDLRIKKKRGGTLCLGCRDELKAFKNLTRPVTSDDQSDPVADAARAAWLQAWADGIDATIDRIRREEGFDGREQTWQTLGE